MLRLRCEADVRKRRRVGARRSEPFAQYDYMRMNAHVRSMTLRASQADADTR